MPSWSCTPDPISLDPTLLWREGLVLVYRLLFILKLEAPSDEGAGFSFASTRLWRTALSPNQALGPLVRRHLDRGVDTGQMLEAGLRTLFAIFRDGLTCSELHITSLGGRLFGAGTIPLLDRLDWGDRAVAILLDRLIWTTTSGGQRARVHYGSLDVEDLGSVYEALLEQEPGIATEPMIRKRHGRLETVSPRGKSDGTGDARSDVIPTGRFFLRAGMGRKASGSFYTPHEFVRFLVHEALEPKIAALSPAHDPRPAALLSLKIVDPATGSGHFLVEACRYVGEALLTACRLCDERGLCERIAALPDADNTIAPYLPSRITDGSGGILRNAGAGDLPPPGRGALPVRLRPQQTGGRTGKALAMARILCRGLASDIPRPPPDPWRCVERAVLCVAVDTPGDRPPARSAAGAGRRGTSRGWLGSGTTTGRRVGRLHRPGSARSAAEGDGEGTPRQRPTPVAPVGAGLDRGRDDAGEGRRRRLVAPRRTLWLKRDTGRMS